MHEMPVDRESVRAGVLAHRRNKYAVSKSNIPNRQGIKQVRHTQYAAFLNHCFDAATEIVCAYRRGGLQPGARACPPQWATAAHLTMRGGPALRVLKAPHPREFSQ